jgi:hypothetical protein
MWLWDTSRVVPSGLTAPLLRPRAAWETRQLAIKAFCGFAKDCSLGPFVPMIRDAANLEVHARKQAVAYSQSIGKPKPTQQAQVNAGKHAPNPASMRQTPVSVRQTPVSVRRNGSNMASVKHGETRQSCGRRGDFTYVDFTYGLSRSGQRSLTVAARFCWLGRRGVTYNSRILMFRNMTRLC